MTKDGRWPPRTVRLEGWRTTVRLEPAFWDALADVAQQQGISIHQLVARLNAARHSDEALSSAIRVFLLTHYRAIAARRH